MWAKDFWPEILQTVVDLRDSRLTTGESRKMTDFHRIPIHQVQEFRHESHGDRQSVKGVRSGRDATAEMFAAMDKFNEELINAGIMLDGTGLTPSSRGARVRFSGSNRTVTDGPFAETKEIIAGFMIWKVSSLQEAIDWVKKFPTMSTEDSDVEIRPLMEPEDFAGVVTPERLEEVKELEARSGDRDGYGLARFK